MNAPWLQGWLDSEPSLDPAHVAVALSGGADSTALWCAWLHAVAHSTAPRALHVNHGLQTAADAFEVFCRRLVQDTAFGDHRASLHVHRLSERVPPGESLEAFARNARYRALATMAKDAGSKVVLLAHHADDQIESMLLALSRGAGPAGVAGMATTFERDGVRFVRPFLLAHDPVTADGLKAWLQAQAIRWVDDPSNADLTRTRNRIRHVVMPALRASSTALHATWLRSARLAHDAAVALELVADEDLRKVGAPPVIERLQDLPPSRLTQVLRLWLRRHHATTGSEAQLQALMRVIEACTTRAHDIHIRVGRGFVERAARGDVHLAFIADATDAEPSPPSDRD